MPAVMVRCEMLAGMTATIRSAEPRDLEAAGRLGAALMAAHHAFDPLRFLEPHTGTEKGYASFLGSILRSGDARVFVAVDDDDAVVGYVFVALEPMSWKELRGPAGFIHDVVVVEHARRSGIATALMNAALDWLRERGAPRVVLQTASRNEAARAFFAKRFGFRETMVEMTRELGD